ncbi:MAG TPA: DUF547 domain-containing protein [Trichocoleus sp.]
MIDVSLWDTLLRTYVNDRGQVDYQRWKAEATEVLDTWLASLAPLYLENLSQAEALALLLNLYNALTIQQVLRQYPIASIRPKILGVSNWLAFLRFFTKSVYQVNEKSVSLNGIEHGILRKQFVEPRIHFALVCASIGCPLLRPQAYRLETVYDKLEEDAQRFIQNPNKVHYDATSNVLYCSRIFKWYGKDFLKVAPSVPAYIGNYLAPNTPLDKSASIQYLPYDWSLNQTH